MQPPAPLPRLAADITGTAAVQFALVAPMLLLLIIGSFEIAMLLLVSGMVESSVLAASRYGVTGYTEEGVSRVDRIARSLASGPSASSTRTPP